LVEMTHTTMYTDLTIIVLSYNTKDITNECLTRVKVAKLATEKALGNKVETVVVENASEDGSLEMIRQKHSWAKLIVSKTNTGFSGGNNLALKEVKTSFVLLLNSDAYIEEDTLIKAMEYFEKNPECDVLGCKLKFADGRLQPSGGYLPTPLNTVLWISGLSIIPGLDSHPIHPRDKSFFTEEKEVDWVMGAFFMFKKEVYNKTGGFDETIFMYGEEVEWCKRIKDNGFKMFYAPEFAITHLDKASSKFMLEKPLLNEIKGIVRFFKQHYKAQYSWVSLVMRVCLMMRVVAFTLLGNGQRRRAYVEAMKVF
jgi:GT2 family glycosyltransferase